MRRDLERKNLLGALYDILIAGGSPTALGLAAEVAAALAAGYGVYRLGSAVLTQISDYLVARDFDLAHERDQIRQALAAFQEEPDAAMSTASAVTVRGIMRRIERKMSTEDFFAAMKTIAEIGAGAVALWGLTTAERQWVADKLRGVADHVENAPPPPPAPEEAPIDKSANAHLLYR